MSAPVNPRRPSRADALRLAVVALFFTAAPTAGDIGGCGQAENELDPSKFFSTKQDVDCARCAACSIDTTACARSCSPGLVIKDFPPGCVPLEHDGEVCVDALLVAGCTDYASYMADQGSTIPTECNFCPALLDAGAGASDAEAE